MITIDYSNISDLPYIASQLLQIGKDYRIWAFYGEMASGKTTLIAELSRQLNVLTKPSSPTFAIIHEYPTQQKYSVFHIDLYRIKKLSELFDIALEDYLDSNHYVFIEWPEVADTILSSYQVLKIKLTVNEQGNRIMYIYV